MIKLILCQVIKTSTNFANNILVMIMQLQKLLYYKNLELYGLRIHMYIYIYIYIYISNLDLFSELQERRKV